jgi:hypothetical protein
VWDPATSKAQAAASSRRRALLLRDAVVRTLTLGRLAASLVRGRVEGHVEGAVGGVSAMVVSVRVPASAGVRLTAGSVLVIDKEGVSRTQQAAGAWNWGQPSPPARVRACLCPRMGTATVVGKVGVVWLLRSGADRAFSLLPVPSIRAFCGGAPARAVGEGGESLAVLCNVSIERTVVALLETEVPVIVGTGMVLAI